MKKRYKSKVSYGLLIVLFIVLFSPILINLSNKKGNEITLTIFLICGLLYVFIAYMFFKTEYLIENQKLYICCGFIKYKPIDILTIKEISKTHNIISSPAASFDRIEIKYENSKEIILSPKDKLSFIKDLIEINPEIDSKLIV